MRQAMNSPSGRNARRICTSVPGRSFTLCRASSDTARSRLSGAKGNASSSATRPCQRPDVTAPASGAARRTAPTRPVASSACAAWGWSVPRSSATSKFLSTAAMRSPRSSAARSSRKAAPGAAVASARCCLRRSIVRSKITGAPSIALPSGETRQGYGAARPRRQSRARQGSTMRQPALVRRYRS